MINFEARGLRRGVVVHASTTVSASSIARGPVLAGARPGHAAQAAVVRVEEVLGRVEATLLQLEQMRIRAEEALLRIDPPR